MFNDILIPALAIGAIGLFFGGLLGFASIVFKVEKDERIDRISEILPGANCGGCGYAGCSALAEAVVLNGESAAKCNLMTDEKNQIICGIMGIKAENVQKKTAEINCCEISSACSDRYDFTGINDCYTAMQLNGGQKNCEYGCLGFGDCVKECNFNALSISDKIAKISYENCVGCGRCAAKCPKNLISMVDESKKYFVACSSNDKGNIVKNYCSNGCIGCKICEKNCEFDAIHVENNLAKIDYDKCTSCGSCASACPKGVIHLR